MSRIRTGILLGNVFPGLKFSVLVESVLGETGSVGVVDGQASLMVQSVVALFEGVYDSWWSSVQLIIRIYSCR